MNKYEEIGRLIVQAAIEDMKSLDAPLQEDMRDDSLKDLLSIREGAEPPWMAEAKKYIGIDEDADEDKVLAFASTAGTPIESSETPWCAIFVNAMLAACGLKPTGTMRARDFAEWGQACEERIGAIVVYKSHVGVVPEPGKVLGGNQSDGVNIGEQRWYGTPIAYRWPEEYQV